MRIKFDFFSCIRDHFFYEQSDFEDVETWCYSSQWGEKVLDSV